LSSIILKVHFTIPCPWIPSPSLCPHHQTVTPCSWLEQLYTSAYCNSAATGCQEQVLLTYQSSGAYDTCRTRRMEHEHIKKLCTTSNVSSYANTQHCNHHHHHHHCLTSNSQARGQDCQKEEADRSSAPSLSSPLLPSRHLPSPPFPFPLTSPALPSPPLFLEVGPLNPARGLGSAVSSHSGVLGRATAEIDFGVF